MATQNIAKAWFFQDILLEEYCYAVGSAESLPKHSHEEYQVYIDSGLAREFYFRGIHYSVPIGSLAILHPGEMHAVRDLEDRQTPTILRLMYLPCILVKKVASEIVGHVTSLPFWSDVIFDDSQLIQLALKCHFALRSQASRLEQDTALLSFLSSLILHDTKNFSSLKPIKREHQAIQRVRDFLQDNYAQNVTITDLSQIANLSPYHLNRAFCAEVGIPPHQYQTQIRITHASRLLTQGIAIAEVASATGFTDQSHLTRHFKRLMQVTPGRYRQETAKTYKN
ncbi:helix-turn-helix transcriptional regulator [Leptolyngbya sp. NK1-12]|uniref:Helix-turn-helix transcriptional regulator n=1 Tax=Leptolyngbya sp. NK1-12 TaxID=2547451 RepID=A0AA96WWV5_9CYAN|nr:AraC family transcriptional regulator [Leptolyngbya sp. NK1-12]WNZ25557.1 helix-turn-helix transcriptional regulator [Leptolyngbya sp. NK1-12]